MTSFLMIFILKFGIPFIEQVFILLFTVRLLNCFNELRLKDKNNIFVLFIVPIFIVNFHSFFTLPVFNSLFDKVMPIIQLVSVFIGIAYTSFSIFYVTKKEFKKILRYVSLSFLVYLTLQSYVVLSLSATTSITIKAINDNNITACVISAAIEFLIFGIVLGLVYNDKYAECKKAEKFDVFSLIFNAKELRNDFLFLVAILIIVEFIFCFVFGYCNALKNMSIFLQITIYTILALFPFLVLWLNSRHVSTTYYLSELFYKDNIHNINSEIDKAINLALKRNDYELLTLLLSIKSSNATT